MIRFHVLVYFLSTQVFKKNLLCVFVAMIPVTMTCARLEKVFKEPVHMASEHNNKLVAAKLTSFSFLKLRFETSTLCVICCLHLTA